MLSITDHFCKLKENSPQIDADFVTQIGADRIIKISESHSAIRVSKATRKHTVRKDGSLIPAVLNADER